MSISHIDFIHLEFDDFKDGDAIEKLLGIDFEEIGELECRIICSISGGAKQTHWQPGEPPEIDDLDITYHIDGQDFWSNESFELKDKLTKASLERFCEQALFDSVEYE